MVALEVELGARSERSGNGRNLTIEQKAVKRRTRGYDLRGGRVLRPNGYSANAGNGETEGKPGARPLVQEQNPPHGEGGDFPQAHDGRIPADMAEGGYS